MDSIELNILNNLYKNLELIAIQARGATLQYKEKRAKTLESIKTQLLNQIRLIDRVLEDTHTEYVTIKGKENE